MSQTQTRKQDGINTVKTRFQLFWAQRVKDTH